MITGKTCEGQDKFCPFFLIDSDGKATCQSINKIPAKQYPGGACSSNSDCIFGVCTNTTCTGIEDGQTCSDQNCNFNRACYSLTVNATKTCNPLRKIDEPCTDDYECPFNNGCFQGYCKAYFSFMDDTDVSKKTKSNIYSFCSSGYDLKGNCITMRNLDENGKPTDEFVKCSNSKECTYILPNNTVRVENNSCENCGKSKDGFIYCPVYSGKSYSRYVNFVKKTLSDPNYASKCNTIEREGVCNYHKKNSDNFKELIETFSTYEIRKSFSQEFANADDCIIQIFNQNFNPKIDNPDGPLPVDETKCPIFRCDSTDKLKEKQCATTTFDNFNKRLNVSLFTKSCSWDKELCDFKKDYNTTVETQSKCINKTNSPIGKQYPGEECDQDNDCYALDKTGIIGTCGNKTKLCLGKEKGETCGSTAHCLIGLYCNKGELKSTCEYQLGKNQNCTNTYDCANNLACVNNTCKDAFYSLNIGDEISSAYDSNIGPEYFCKTKLTRKSSFDNKTRCIGRNHTDAKNSSESDLVRCNYDQMCNYTLSDNLNNVTEQLTCDCGFNMYGQGYCKRGHDASNYLFIILFIISSFLS